MDDKDLHVRVIDQRIGMGVGGLDTVIRAYHVPTGLLVEVPTRLFQRGQYYARQTAIEMLEYALAQLAARPAPATADPVVEAARVLLEGSPLLTAFCRLMFQGKPIPSTYAECDAVICNALRAITGASHAAD